jgi:uncharacterized iron-regulated membrane protein
MAMIFGLPMKIIVCVMGFVVTALSMTGVYIWWRKRRAQIAHARIRSSGERVQVETI